MKFFISSMERLENKIEKLCNENTLLKQEVKSLKAGADFQSERFEAKRDLGKMGPREPIRRRY